VFIGVGVGIGLLDAPAAAGGVSAPSNSVAPAVTGTVQVGQTLTSTTGTWSGSPSYAYQWKRGGANISGETASTYVLALADVGTNIVCAVTATNAGGSVSADSNTTAVGNNPYVITAKTVAWWTADAGITSSSGNVSSWVDRISSIDMTQTGADSIKPSYSATGWNASAPGVTFDGDALMSTANVPAAIPTGANASEIWVVFDCTSAGADADITRDMMSYGGTTNGTYRSIRRASSSSVNRIRAADGTTTTSNTTADIAGRHYGRASWTGTAQDVSADGGTAASAAVTPATGTTRVRFGNTPAIGTTGFEGVIRDGFILNAVPTAGEITALNAYCSGRAA
jgi:hypothetical protein